MTPPPRREPAALLFIAGIFVGSFLLFQIEPMIAKQLLPSYGGSAALWNTCLLFFQTLLLAGYLYAHLLSRWPLARQRVIHTALLFLPLLALPVARSLTPTSPNGSPLISLIGTLAATVGASFFVLSTNSTLLQHWYVRRAAREPYFLYGASNAGSLIALCAYPLLVETTLGLRAQWRLFALLYLLFATLTLLCLRATRAVPLNGNALPKTLIASPLPSRAQRALWVFRSSVASLLLPAISLRIATDVSAMPLLWVAPLALYLLSFVLAFLPAAPYPRSKLEMIAVCGIVVGLGATPTAAHPTLWLQLAIPLVTLFVGCWICHGDLARDRPPPDRLTGFFVYVAVGGFIGALFGNLIAPLVFTSIAEHPIALFLLSLALALGDDRGARLASALKRPITYLGWAIMIACIALWLVKTHADPTAASPYWNVIPIALLVVLIPLWRVPAQLPFATGLVALVTVAGLYTSGRVLTVRRGFYGVLRIMETSGLRTMIHGTTIHGAWRASPPSALPTAYYHPASPISRVVAEQGEHAHIAVVGLGTGSIAAYSKPDQTLTFFEIDPLVEPMARAWFPFLDHAKSHLAIVLGDARLELQSATRNSFDLIVLDAFSSDAIPTHLMTDEAFALYLDKLAPNGILLAHISNRYLDLEPILRGVVEHFGLHAVVVRYSPTAEATRESAAADHVVALARSASVLAPLGAGWVPLGEGRSLRWTDDRSSVLPLLHQ